MCIKESTRFSGVICPRTTPPTFLATLESTDVDQAEDCKTKEFLFSFNQSGQASDRPFWNVSSSVEISCSC